MPLTCLIHEPIRVRELVLECSRYFVLMILVDDRKLIIVEHLSLFGCNLYSMVAIVLVAGTMHCLCRSINTHFSSLFGAELFGCTISKKMTLVNDVDGEPLCSKNKPQPDTWPDWSLL